jgi:hypothetical protein
MILRWGMVALLMLGTGERADKAQLTVDGMRAWMVSTHSQESSGRVIHEQFNQMRAELPPWYPKHVIDEVEQAYLDIDLAPVATPYYSACLTDDEARMLAKVGATEAGRQFIGPALAAKENAAGAGSSPADVQQAVKASQDSTKKPLTQKQIDSIEASLTPRERSLLETWSSSENNRKFTQCSIDAYAKMAVELERLQSEAMRTVLEKDGPEVRAAHASWDKEHPEAPKQEP